MDYAEKGDIVDVHYTIKYTNGTVYDSTIGKDPFRFKLGDKVFFPGFEKAIEGMTIGENKIVTVKGNDMFQQSEDLITDIPLDHVPDHVNKEVGQRVRIDQDNLPPLIALITAISDTHITLDANLPMAGKDFLLSLELLDILRYE